MAEWAGVGLEAALAASRTDDLRRGVSTVGPHRDDVDLRLAGLPTRTHASQGEQRSLALALRLAAHHVITEVTGSAPVLLLDDVFSELDPDRSDACSPTSRGPDAPHQRQRAPPKARPDLVLEVRDGRIARGVTPSARVTMPDHDSGGCPERAAATMAGCPPDRSRVRDPGRARSGSRSTPSCGASGAPEASGVHLVFDRWSEVVGEALAARTRPLRMDGGRLVLAVDEPAIATHVRFLQAELLARLEALLGPGRVTALDLRVGPKK